MSCARWNITGLWSCLASKHSCEIRSQVSLALEPSRGKESLCRYQDTVMSDSTRATFSWWGLHLPCPVWLKFWTKQVGRRLVESENFIYVYSGTLVFCSPFLAVRNWFYISDNQDLMNSHRRSKWRMYRTYQKAKGVSSTCLPKSNSSPVEFIFRMQPTCTGIRDSRLSPSYGRSFLQGSRQSDKKISIFNKTSAPRF